ncbi:DNA adenine methylase [Candidatus Arsenophonus lipoptenae]|uniref:Site-specific DNA-methyltransferase (adenine-specific) n=1 Tax=Candidatus Arsenophonus lipoptenae TaxID=634113 RepID=A0A0X9W2Z0_9GAMM|nr:Dam family site-specific DNA-(adenine-N6)-methyltransferase [Candidatus Arsenophonus lipoptenae]AMA64879.1 DNA adenine methylase [Candidatus Arsenophonus lipoptenae]
MKKKRAFLKWAGGKFFMIEEIKKYLPEANCLVEPFVGAGSIFLNTNYNNYILADINNDLINLYNTVKYYNDSFILHARKLFNNKFNTAEQYYRLRTEFNLSSNSKRRSILFLYLNRHCYNGLCRYNAKGEFNVPFGCHKNPYFPENELYAFAEKAQKAIFICQHYKKTLLSVNNNSVVYCDPPYTPLSNTAKFMEYSKDRFGKQEQYILAKIAYLLSSTRGIPVLISNHDTPYTRKWYHNAKLNPVKSRRLISCNSLTRKKVNEILAFYNPTD